MSDLVEWMRNNAKEGANLAEFEDLLSGRTLDGIDSKEKALKAMLEHKLLKAAYDSEISKKIANHDDRFKEEKLPLILQEERAKLMKELNPEETAEQKTIREMKEKLDRMESEKRQSELREQLRAKAKELNYDPDRAANLAILGDFDKASAMIEDQANYLKTTLDAERTKLVNSGLGGDAPTGGDNVDGSLTMDKIASMSIDDLEREFK